MKLIRDGYIITAHFERGTVTHWTKDEDMALENVRVFRKAGVRAEFRPNYLFSAEEREFNKETKGEL